MPAYLGKLPKTRFTAQVVRTAALAGLNPHISFAPYQGIYEIVLDAKKGPGSAFGVIRVGARSGRILRIVLFADNSDDGVRAAGPRACRTTLDDFVFHTGLR